MENTGSICGIETNLFNKETIYEDASVQTDEGIYTHVIVQVWENTYTGEQSIGWYKTPDTELVEED